MAWYRRRYERRAARRAARMLVALEGLAATRSKPAPRAVRASIGATR